MSGGGEGKPRATPGTQIFRPFRPLIRGFSTTTSTLGYIVVFTVAAGTFLMAISLLSGKPEATKDVLPFATGLVGFLGGLVTAMFGSSQRTTGQLEAEREETEAPKSNDQEQKP